MEKNWREISHDTWGEKEIQDDMKERRNVRIQKKTIEKTSKLKGRITNEEEKK